MSQRLADLVVAWNLAEPLDASVLAVAVVAVLLVVAHALWTRATQRNEDWIGEGNVRPWW